MRKGCSVPVAHPWASHTYTRPVCSIFKRGDVRAGYIGSDSASLNQRNFSRLALAEKTQEP